MQRAILAIVILAGFLPPASAIEILSSTGTATYQNTEPTSTDVSNWTSGWGSSGVTGWNYVGQVNGASAVYLGNGWVITAGHVGTGDFTLGGETYTLVAGSANTFTTTYNDNGTITTDPADLTMFRISTTPSLSALSVATLAPSVGSSVVMTGYGGGQGETWGDNSVTASNILVGVNSYTTVDFETAYSTSNTAVLVAGDSGGADFIYNTFTHKWQLVGLNEAIGTGVDANNSYFIELSAYSSQISSIQAAPEPATWVLLVFSLVAGIGYKFLRSRRSPPVP